MFIQKLDIKKPVRESSPKFKNKLSKSCSSCNLSTSDNLSQIYSLPYISNDSKINKDSVILSHLNVYDLRNISQNKNNEYSFLKFKPKRLIKIRNGSNELPFTDFRNLPLNEDKVFGTQLKENNLNSNQQLISFSTKKANEFFDEDNLRLKKYAFKSIYLLKLEKNIENFEKYKLNHNLITPNKIAIFDELTYKISKIMKSQKSFFIQSLNDINENSLNEDKNIKIPTPKNSSDISPINNSIKINNIINNNNINNSIDKILKKEIILNCEYNSLVNKLFSFLLNEIDVGKAENFKLLQKNHEEELIINSKTKSLNELNKYINRYDVNNKINYNKKQEQKQQTIKEYYNMKKNEYISQIYKLENEIKILTTLLNKNKIFFDKYKEYEEEIGKNKKENENIKRDFKRELREKNNLVMYEKNKEKELNDQLDDMKTVIEDLKKEKNNIKKLNLLDKNMIKKLEYKINEKNENIVMINEELEWYIKQNENMKKILNDRESTIKTMEMKLNKENLNKIQEVNNPNE